jgi:hypothetical protein
MTGLLLYEAGMPISLSAYPFCHGEPAAMGLSRIPIIRRECLDDIIVFGEAHLHRILGKFVAF